ncbi:hypothetical protein B566_EDAN008206 [Ephemera danica]|nr:hypothetical protein B566_EDAN008206 [Ephemera danica]
MSFKSKNGFIACVITFFCFLLIAIAFSTPCWLETDGELKDATFIRIGLWQVCFQNFEEPHHWYDTKLTGCWWVFEEEYYIIHDFLLPPFFVATQTFFTFCLTFLLFSLMLLFKYMVSSKGSPRLPKLLFILSALTGLSALCGSIACIIFGARGDGRDWMPNWEHNNISWSYALAVIGTLLLWVTTAQFFAEGRVLHFKLRAERQQRGAYSMDPVKH